MGLPRRRKVDFGLIVHILETTFLYFNLSLSDVYGRNLFIFFKVIFFFRQVFLLPALILTLYPQQYILYLSIKITRFELAKSKASENLSPTKQLVHNNLLIFSSSVPPFFKHRLHTRRDILSIVRPSGPGRQIRWVSPHPSNRFFSNIRTFLLKLLNLMRLIAATEDYRARRLAVIVGSDLIWDPRLRFATRKKTRELSLCSFI